MRGKFSKVIFFFCIIYMLSLAMMGSVMARFTSSLNGEDSARVAIMANDVTTSLNVALKGYPGSSVTYPLVLTNADNDKVCEVSQGFTVKLLTDDSVDIPLVYELYLDEGLTEKISPNGDGVYSSSDFKFKANVYSEKVVYIKISWPESVNDISFADEIEYFKLNVVIDQI